jgi:hypothetical protein
VRITKFQISNYKSYNEPVKFEFGSGINIVTGQNNAGKTALLEALSLKFAPTPHRSLKTVPTVGQAHNQTTRIEVSLQVSSGELRELMLRFRDTYVFLPTPRLNTEFWSSMGYTTHDDPARRKMMEWFLSSDRDFDLILEGPPPAAPQWSAARIPSFSSYEISSPPSPHFEANRYFVAANPELSFSIQPQANVTAQQEIGAMLGPGLSERVYVFRAERLNIGTSPFGLSSQLAPDARNLAEVLNRLQHNQARFDRLNQNLRQVLPQLRGVTVRPWANQSSYVEIVVWPHDPQPRERTS